MWLIISLGACQFLTEVRDPPSEVNFGGTIYDGVPTGDDDPVLSVGTVDFMVPTIDLAIDRQLLIDNGQIWAATQPYSSSPGYWQATLPVETKFAVRLEAEGSYPSVFAGLSPSWDGYWFAGVLFSWDKAYTDDFMGGLADQLSVSLDDLNAGQSVHMWGLLRDDDEAQKLEGRHITVTDGEGVEARVYAFELTEEGLLSENLGSPVHYFFAMNLAPGDVQLRLEGPSGDAVIEHYPTRGGDMIGAWWLGVPE
jgi:hypothetical protein